jgi:hypothetical protein
MLGAKPLTGLGYPVRIVAQRRDRVSVQLDFLPE